MKLDLVDRKRSPQFFEECLPVAVVAKDRLAVIAPASDVIISPGEQDAERSRHILLLSVEDTYVNNKDLTPLFALSLRDLQMEPNQKESFETRASQG